jgi:hypothetical protein
MWYVAAVWAFMWLVCFAFLTDQWRVTDSYYKYYSNKDAAQAALAFAFFSLLIYVCACNILCHLVELKLTNVIIDEWSYELKCLISVVVDMAEFAMIINSSPS